MLKAWGIINPEKVALVYEGGKALIVSKVDFDRAFGAIVSASYDDVKRDFAI